MQKEKLHFVSYVVDVNKTLETAHCCEGKWAIILIAHATTLKMNLFFYSSIIIYCVSAFIMYVES